MSILFGIKSEHEGAKEQDLMPLADATSRFAPDGTAFQVFGHVAMGIQFRHTHERSTLETTPLLDPRGTMISWDGRLDNHLELRDELEINVPSASDSAIVLAAFSRWGEACFDRLVGEWAVAIWAEEEGALYLARDHAGTRTLFYRNDASGLLWATHLDGLLMAAQTSDLCPEYIACMLTGQGRRQLTPFQGVQAVLPGHYLRARKKATTLHRYWNWQASRSLSRLSDEDYEGLLRDRFATAVLRRIGKGSSTVAQLSGGMDSTSIVAMADHLRSGLASSLPRLDTISFYDDSEPDWNERPSFTEVERWRRQTGIHVEVSFAKRHLEPPRDAGFWAMPGFDRGRADTFRIIHEQMKAVGYTSVISGMGGDELLGGVPSPLPELGDCLLSRAWHEVFRRAIAWSLPGRTPLLHTVTSTFGFLVDVYGRRAYRSGMAPPWATQQIRRLAARAEAMNPIHSRRIGVRPSRIANDATWWAMVETLPHLESTPFDRMEFRYPYLDKELVEFLFQVPRDQLVRPRQRRSLMRRAFQGIVPGEVLAQKRKAVVSRGPLRLIEASQEAIHRMFAGSLLAALGWIDVPRFHSEIKNTIERRDPTWSLPLLNTVYAEMWLQSSTASGRIRC